MECITTTFTPTNDDPLACPDGNISTSCVVSPTPLVYLGLAGNPTQSQINTALISSLISKDQIIADLTARIEALEP